MSEVPPVKHGYTKRRIFAIAGLSFLAFMIYRIFAVYTVRSGECGIKPTDPLPLLTGGAKGWTEFPPRSDPPADTPVVIASYNIEGHATLWRSDHVEKVAGAIRALNADVVGLQEVHRGTWQSRFHDQATALARETGMHVFFGKSYRSVGGGEFGNAILTRGRIYRATVHELPSVGEPRTLLEVETEIGGRRVNCFVAHLATWGKLNRKSREAQVQCIVEHIRRSRLPFVLVGDLNTTPSTPEIARIDASRIVQQVIPPSDITHQLTAEHIDYVFADRGFGIRATHVPHVGPSDHWPVVAELTWAKGSS